QASIQVNDNPKVDSNIVPVTPVDPPTPPETPEVEKSVEGEDGEFVKELVEKEYEKSYRYHVTTVVPKDLEGYESIILSDEIDDRLTIVDTKVLVDGEAFDHGVTKQGQLVTLEMTREVLDEIAGKELTLEITAQIKDGTPIEVIDNQANIQVNDN